MATKTRRQYIILTYDTDGALRAEDIPYDSNYDIKDKIDEVPALIALHESYAFAHHEHKEEDLTWVDNTHWKFSSDFNSDDYSRLKVFVAGSLKQEGTDYSVQDSGSGYWEVLFTASVVSGTFVRAFWIETVLDV